MTTTRKLTLALPFVFLAACSSNRSTSDTMTSSGSLDTAAFGRDTNPVLGDTTKKGTAMDSAMKDSTMMRQHSQMISPDTSKKTSTKSGTTKKPYKP